MDDAPLGRRFRALRHRLGWRQEDLATRAGVSRGLISLIERGRIDEVTTRRLRRVGRELDAEYVAVLRWRGGDLDRLMDEGHATLVGRAAAILRADGWEVQIELSYSVYGERGSIDILAWHAPTRLLLVIEVKTEFVALEATLRKHDEKARLAAQIARERLGWNALGTARLLVLPSTSTARRRVDRHAAVMDVSYPLRGASLRRWMAAPSGSHAGLLFIDVDQARTTGRAPISRKRVRRRVAAVSGRLET
jgi:transcriptional regulator with XRE-family HTH domain